MIQNPQHIERFNLLVQELALLVGLRVEPTVTFMPMEQLKNADGLELYGVMSDGTAKVLCIGLRLAALEKPEAHWPALNRGEWEPERAIDQSLNDPMCGLLEAINEIQIEGFTVERGYLHPVSMDVIERNGEFQARRIPGHEPYRIKGSATIHTPFVKLLVQADRNVPSYSALLSCRKPDGALCVVAVKLSY